MNMMDNENKLPTPFELFNVECGKGWNNIIQPLFDYIEQYNKEHDDKIEVLQVKEKFGSLRFYTNFFDNKLGEMIEDAESESNETCELCGSKEKVGKTFGWITTCCQDCAKKIAKNRNNTIKWRPNKIEDNFKFYLIDKDGNIEKVERLIK